MAMAFPQTPAVIRPLHTINGLMGPCDVAVSENGKVVVCEYVSHSSEGEWEGRNGVTVFSEEWERITTIGPDTSGLTCPQGVAITCDNRILVTDEWNHRVKMFDMDDMEGLPVRSIGQKGDGELQFNGPKVLPLLTPLAKCL